MWRFSARTQQADRVTVTGASPDRLMLLLPSRSCGGHSHHWMARLSTRRRRGRRGYRPGVAARVEIHHHTPTALERRPVGAGGEAGEGRLRRGGTARCGSGAEAMACQYTGWGPRPRGSVWLCTVP